MLFRKVLRAAIVSWKAHRSLTSHLAGVCYCIRSSVQLVRLGLVMVRGRSIIHVSNNHFVLEIDQHFLIAFGIVRPESIHGPSMLAIVSLTKEASYSRAVMARLTEKKTLGGNLYVRRMGHASNYRSVTFSRRRVLAGSWFVWCRRFGGM